MLADQDDVDGCRSPVVHAGDPRRAYALAAANFWAAQPETCIAVTGTNGKTSVAGFARRIFARARPQGSASMGTLGVSGLRGRQAGPATDPAGPDHAGRRRRRRD